MIESQEHDVNRKKKKKKPDKKHCLGHSSIQYFRKGKNRVRSLLVIQLEEQNDCKGTGGNFGSDSNIPTMTAEVIIHNFLILLYIT